MNTEKDPSGKNPHSPGAKLDLGKTRLGLVLLGFARALQAVGDVGTFGARKYTDDGWIEVENGQARYTDALMRHLISEARGEKLDPESGLRHAAQVAWNALDRLDIEIRSEETSKNAPEKARTADHIEGILDMVGFRLALPHQSR